MIRWSLIYIAILAIVALGMRDWFKALCALIVLSVLHEHQYFRDPFAGVPGLRLMNLLLPVVLWQWLTQRGRERLDWDAPAFLRRGVVAYVLVLVYGVALALPDFDLLQAQGWTAASFGYNEVVAPLMPILLAVMLYDGARSRERIVTGLAALVLMAAIAGAYIIKLIPVSSLLDGESFLRYRLRIDRQFGLHPNDVVSILVPGMWIATGCLLLARRNLHRLALTTAAVVMAVALLLTQSRTGMLGLLGVTLVLGLARFRAAATAVILAATGAYLALPSIAVNVSRGVRMYSIEGRDDSDINEITNGRVEMWGIAWKDIWEAPLLGHGDLYWSRVWVGHEIAVGSHPHNAYLEVWLAYGLIGLLIVLSVFLSLLLPSMRLLRKGRSRLELAVGLGATACIVTHLVVGMGGRAFLPRVSAVITFCMCALAMRTYVMGRSLLVNRPAPGPVSSVRVLRRIRIAPLPGAAEVRSRAGSA